MSPPQRLSKKCSICRATEQLLWCADCKRTYCGKCWDKCPPHLPPTPSDSDCEEDSSSEHLKSELDVADLVYSILRPKPKEELEQSHEINLETKWFGVTDSQYQKARISTSTSIDPSEAPRFYSTGRLRSILSCSIVDREIQFPSLVSFVGDTGAGKSTLINALIETNSDKNLKNEVPVVGATTGRPTSGDVHLFADPKTLNGTYPLLYGDCEGLDGGSTPAAGSLTKMLFELRLDHGTSDISRLRVRHALSRKIRGCITREIQLPEGHKTYQWIANNLYPTILFTFSDVVCFISRGTRKLEYEVDKLINWAERSFSRSLNQTVLPHAIIVINALEPTPTDGDWWDVDYATTTQLEGLNSIVQDDNGDNLRGNLHILAKQWRKKERKIITLKDLILCYFGGFSIICIPHSKYSPALINTQYHKLYYEIQRAKKEVRDKRCNMGLLMHSEELDEYVDMAFDHFSQNPKDPFDFMDAALRRNPIDPTFSDHILNLLVYLAQMYSEVEALEKAAPLVASCIVLEVYRKRYPNRGEEHQRSHEMLRININVSRTPGDSIPAIEALAERCKEAVEVFQLSFWRCEVTHFAWMSRKTYRCANSKSGHSKGHQTASGTSFGYKTVQGFYSPDLETHKNKFLMTVKNKMEELFEQQKTANTRTLSGDRSKEIIIVATSHAKSTLSKMTDVWTSNIHYSQKTCFCCLNSVPIHVLNCDHIICQNCLENYSSLSPCRNFLQVSVCPLCYNIDKHWDPKWKARVTPSTAGLRVLSLDGGGIRSIIQLELLRKIEECIGLGVPIRDFFDLMVGTSGGGIVALGLGARGLGVDKCTELFKDLSRRAFTFQMFGSVKLVNQIVMGIHQGIYKTSMLEKALQDFFGMENPLFGPSINQNFSSVKVAVTTTDSSNNHECYILTNYNRSTTKESKTLPFYTFYRGSNVFSEPKIWEAARATSAAPTYFKPFQHTRFQFEDGGIRYNNPAEIADMERKRIWPELAGTTPDIFLSIGTGVTKIPEPPKKKPQLIFLSKGHNDVLQFVIDTLNNSMNSETAWVRYNSVNQECNFRLNPKLETIPALDEVAEIDNLQNKVRELYENSDEIKRIAFRLIASLFYLEEEPMAESVSNDVNNYCGSIFCRLDSAPLKKLCQRLSYILDGSAASNNIQNVFFINDWNSSSHKFIPLGIDSDKFKSTCLEIIDGNKTVFKLSVSNLWVPHTEANNLTEIVMCFEVQNPSELYPISGFPRPLQGLSNRKHYSERKMSSLKGRASRSSASTISSASNTAIWPPPPSAV